jgi:Transposase IS4
MLPRNLHYNFYLDNLFTNVPLAKELLNLNVGMTGTTRKNALGFPRWLVKLKEQGRSRGKAMEWGAMRAEVVEGVLCFAWQDNNTMLGITTAYSPDDLVVRTRKRPAETSTNAAIVRPVFGDEYTKDLAIPRLIDEYNHHMGGVDIANQLRESYSTHNRRQKRYWKPLFLWLLDLAITNSYLISQWPRPKKPESRGHRRFMDDLAKSLMGIPLDLADVELPADDEPPERPDVERLERLERLESDTERPESLDTERPEPPGIERPESPVESPDIEWPGTVQWPDAVEWPDVVERPDVEWPLNIEPPSSSLLESADLGDEMEIHVHEKRGKRAYCVYCLQHKEDWEPHKHKPNHEHRQVPNKPRAFGTDLTNIIPKDTRGYRIRGSRTIWYCGTCNVALCKRGSCWNYWHNRDT